MSDSITSTSPIDKTLQIILEVHNLYHQFDDHTPIIDDLSITVKANERIAVVGPSGSGKSTLLHLISGLKSPQKGSIVINKRNITRLPDHELSELRNHHIGFVYQSPCLLKDFSVLENVALALQIGGCEISQARLEAQNTLSMLGIGKLSAQAPSTLSGGEKQRVAIARAIVTKPNLLIADEPTGNLDDENTELIMQTLSQIQSKHAMAMIVATHDMNLLKHFQRTLTLGG
jgi:lipoprotein-releasing system ATP-binding protein